jgi:hypothetical protein
MIDRFNPRVFLVIGIGNWVLVGLSLLACALSLGGVGYGSIEFVFLSIIFTQIGTLALHQYRAMGTINDKLNKMEKSLRQQEELVAK